MASVQQRLEIVNGRKVPVLLKDKKPVYDVEYRDPSGRKRSKSFRSKIEARQFAATVETSKLRGEWIDPKRGRVRFGTYSQEWLETTVHLKPLTQEGYRGILRCHVLPYFAEAPLASIERTHVQKWLSRLQASGLGAGTIRNAFRVLSKILNEATKARLIVANPAAGVSVPMSERKEMHFLSPEEIRDIAETISPRFRALVYFAGYVGLRFGECAALKLENLDLLRGVVQVRASLCEVNGVLHTVAPKTWQVRTVPLPRFLCRILEQHIGQYASSERYVFTSPEGGPLRRNFYPRHFKPTVKRAGHPHVTFHDLRHSAASIAINSGANVKQVQQMLGHSSATVTLDTYSHVWPSLADQLRDTLDSIYEGTQTSTAL